MTWPLLRAIFLREWAQSLRQPADVAWHALFFVVVSSLFPLSLKPDPDTLRLLAPGVQRAARRQVMIEATIVEVTLADGYRQGIDWTRLGVPGWSVRPRGSGDATPGQPTLSYLSANSDIRLELLETFGTVKVLSSPRLSVLNNQTAMFHQETRQLVGLRQLGQHLFCSRRRYSRRWRSSRPPRSIWPSWSTSSARSKAW